MHGIFDSYAEGVKLFSQRQPKITAKPLLISQTIALAVLTIHNLYAVYQICCTNIGEP